MTDKAWGCTERVHVGDGYELWKLVILPGGHSSLHWHELQDNLFSVVSGSLSVLCAGVWCELGVGDSLFVERGIKHMFWSMDGAVVYETCSGVITEDDIFRITVGGVSARQKPDAVDGGV